MSVEYLERIRNFSIIAHIDHGKSTLADRMLELTGTIDRRTMRAQFLDRMELERERGITIKMHPVKMLYNHDNTTYIFNLIDTPGHVDFTYEVSRSLTACEGTILLVDASQGIEAQTLSNAYMAIEAGLEIIPVVNKIDLPQARPKEVANDLANILGANIEDVLFTSAKEGTGIEMLMKAIVERIPPPKGDPENPAKALVFDSIYDSYKGVLAYIRLFDGTLEARQMLKFMQSSVVFETLEIGIFSPEPRQVSMLRAGEVGYIATGIKEIIKVKIGDTITTDSMPAKEPLPGYKVVKPMVFCGLYTSDSDDYNLLLDALQKLSLNDSSFTYEPEVSEALGFGFRLGFLGLLHKEIIQERLEREFDLSLITTTPNVVYEITLVGGKTIRVENPAKMPARGEIESIAEPFIKATIISPTEFIGDIMQICEKKRGDFKTMEYIDPNRVVLEYEMPLSEVIIDFYDLLKSVSRGYASFDYELVGFRSAPLVRLDILVNGEPVDALSTIVHKNNSYNIGRDLVSRLKKVIPRQLFEVVIQASCEGKIISRANVKPLRKNVTAKCYGGDITRKRKLLEKQKAGKKRMKMVGKVEIPQEAFLSILDIQRE
ncbi:MAG: elongation factor 4 [Candidatus Coatesbacteria bacterium 4484_99]|uniref:Elongation factor 4 n=1 Tax=Candidatus Coatesbacteria bacterium 4484_99 TaxID=1970774 RepID=A0A1W9S2I4_9BACT|nr:MAG: elongation factor 4 [Candidatus Coatesbacteria bacterium 4484_99]RLC44561.1 MAG: elongation factor 4 [Candidatus Coatesbacteria bacterium]